MSLTTASRIPLAALFLCLQLAVAPLSIAAVEQDSLAAARLSEENALLRERLEQLEGGREQFRWSRFRESPVLMSGSLTAIDTTLDGRLAFATDRQGLVLFDGALLEVADRRTTGLPDDFVSCTAPLDRERLWVGTGRGLALYDRGRLLVPEGLPPELREAPVSCLAADGDGGLWVGTQGRGLWRLSGGAWEHHLTAGDSAAPSAAANINDLLLMPGGELWAATAGDGVYRLESDARQVFPAPLGPGSEEVYCLALDRDGLVWIGTAAAGAGLWDGIGWRKAPLPLMEGEGVVSLALLEDGDLLFGSTAGVFLLDHRQGAFERFPLPEELEPYPVTAALEHRGKLWLAPSGQGLHLCDRALIERHTAAQGLPSDQVYHLARDPGGKIWCGTWSGAGILGEQGWGTLDSRAGLPADLVTALLFPDPQQIVFATHRGVGILAGGRWRYLDRDSGLGGNTVNHLALDSLGGLWIATEGGGLARLMGDSLRSLTVADGLPSNEVQASAVLPEGTLWAATREGLAFLDGSRFRPAAGDSPGDPAPGPEHFTALTVAADSSLWAATLGRGVWRRRPAGSWEQYTVEQGLGADEVYALTAGARGRVWFGTAMGLSLFDGENWRSYGPADGLEPAAVRALVLEREDVLWLAAERKGLTRLDLARLDPPETFLSLPGGGLLALDRGNLPRLFVPGGDTLRPFPAGVDTLAARALLGHRFYRRLESSRLDTVRLDRLELRCLAVTPWWPGSDAGCRFSWKLDRRPWTPFGYRGEISLTGLARGVHVLSVQAKDQHLRVDPTPVHYSFFVDVPSPWSDWRLYLLSALLVAGAVAAVGRRQLAWRLARSRHRAFRPVEPNPFRPGLPLEGGSLPGREEQLRLIEESLAEGRLALVFHGERQCGVSSLLRQAAARLERQGARALYLDLAERSFPDAAALARELERQLSGPGDTPDSPADPLERLRLRLAAHGPRTILLFDRAERLGRLLERDPASGERLAAVVRELVLGGSPAGFVFGTSRLEEFRARAAVLFGMSRVVRLGTLERPAAREALAAPLAGRVLFQDRALELLTALSDGHPGLLQHLGRAVVEQLNRERAGNLVTLPLVGRALAGLVADPPALVLDRWEELTRREKLLLAAAVVLCPPGAGPPPALALGDLAGVLSGHRLEFLPEELAKIAADLARRGLLEPDRDQRVRVRDSLLERWVRVSQTLEGIAAQEEYDPAEALHRLGRELARSFRLAELAERVLDLAGELLRCEWSALLTVPEGAVRSAAELPLTVLRAEGATAAGVRLPEGLPASTAAALEQLGGAPEDDAAALPGLPAAALTVPLLSRGELSGLLLIGPRRDGGRWSRRDRLLVETIAEQVAAALENVRLYEQETERARLRQELETARRMQLAILPERRPAFPGLEICSYLSPATEVGGDYFDYQQVDPGRVLLLIGDVSGHGISAGTVVYMAKSCLYNQVRADSSVPRVMEAMNAMVHGALRERMLMTLCYGIFDLERRVLDYSIAGHPFPYHYSAARGTLEELELSAYPLGVSPRTSYRSAEVGFGPGDLFVFYSDGIIEGLNPAGEQFGFERFAAEISAGSELDAESLCERLVGEYRAFAAGRPADDDITLVVARIK